MRISDWSSDVCSSDLLQKCRRFPDCQDEQRQNYRHSLYKSYPEYFGPIKKLQIFSCLYRPLHGKDGSRLVLSCFSGRNTGCQRDRKSVVEGKSVSVSVDVGGRRIIKKKNINKK